MFENLIGQDSVRDQLTSALKNGNLPKALLFTGPAYSGKMSAALELARGITCQKDGLWDCDCRSCRDHRVLVNPDNLLLGNRYFLSEIKASADLLLRSRAVFAQYMFIRNIRKLLKRFEPVIWEGMEKKLSRFSSTLAEITEKMELMNPGRTLPEEEELKIFLDETINLSRTLVAAVPLTIPVDQIRNISKWAHLTSSGSAKIVIVEQADKMLESASNSLLKILEEPPPHVSFILLSEKKGTIIPTILSRVRSYDFVPRTKETSSLILDKLFRVEDTDMQLQDYFQEWSDINFSFLKEQVRNFTDCVFTQSSVTDLDILFKFFEDKKNRPVLKSFFKSFLITLSNEIHMRFREDPELSGTIAGQVVMKNLMKEINNCSVNSEIYNQNSLFLLECLFYKTREIYEALC